MQYPTRTRTSRLGRRVHYQRAHSQHATASNGATDRLRALRHLVDLGVTKYAKRMRSGQDTKGSVLQGRIVQMQTQCDNVR